MTDDEAKLLFIRQSAAEAFAKGEIEESTKGILKEIVILCTVASMQKETIGDHIGNLEKARSYLAAHTQGLMTGVEKEALPLFKAKREKERLNKIASKLESAKDKKVNDLISLARDLASKGLVNEEVKVKTPIASKAVCPKCKKEVFSIKFHKC